MYLFVWGEMPGLQFASGHIGKSLINLGFCIDIFQVQVIRQTRLDASKIQQGFIHEITERECTISFQ